MLHNDRRLRWGRRWGRWEYNKVPDNFCRLAVQYTKKQTQKILKENAEQISREGLTALATNEGLQAMLASQLILIHHLQQTAMTMVNALTFSETSQYYMNTAIKLSNTFVQQASLLAKLQGAIGQKFVVERVDVHDGGQAVIGAVNSGTQADKAKI